MTDIEKYIDILEQYNDKSFVYSLLCSKTSRYYNYMKMGFAMPLILTSTALTYINSNNDPSMQDAMRFINPIFNMITAIILGIQNVFKFETKSNQYKQNCIKFQKLSHQIEAKMLNKQDINEDFITSIIMQYDNIQEECMDLPSHICNSIRKEFATKRHLPIIINGISKEPSILCRIEKETSKKEFLNRVQE